MAKIKSDGSLQRLSVAALHLDDGNPRFGGRLSTKGTTRTAQLREIQTLDEIVLQHGITDVLCSISSNGYFDSEPLVGAINKSHGKEVTILEGNRRLTACLILAADERAAKHKSLSVKYRGKNFTEDSKIPVQVYDWSNTEHREKLLPYLGIRHIVGGAQWDSYAKAAWVANTLIQSNLSIEDIRTMIGDDQRFVERIVEGYYFVNQVIETNAYDPAVSLRKGRGSFQEFPFSWVYTSLGYKSVRSFVGLPSEFQVSANPIPEASLKKAGQLLQFLFGASGRNAAIDDSRRIGQLAVALSNDDSLSALRTGDSVEAALEQIEPPENRVSELLKKADVALAKSVAIASGFTGITKETLRELRDQSDQIVERTERLQELLQSSSRRRKRTEMDDSK